MNLRLVVKLGVVLSVMLFCIGVVFYGFARISVGSKYEDIDWLCFVPDDCTGLLESDNIDYFIHEFPDMAYAPRLDTLQRVGLLRDILSDLNRYSFASAHGASPRMNHLLISFHSSDHLDMVAYFWLGRGGKKQLIDAVRKKYGADFVCKEEVYRGEKIEVYPLSPTRYLSVYNEGEILAISYQKKLIEKVVDARKDCTSLHEDMTLESVHQPKSVNHMAIYGRRSSLPFLSDGDADGWSEFDIHLNSEVFYLSGAVYASESGIQAMADRLGKVEPVMLKDSILIVSGRQKVDSCISAVIASPFHSFFDECTVNLSRDASYIMVADMDEVMRHPEKYAAYLPVFVSCHLELFRPFVLSVQITRVGDRLSHIFIFTYKE